jgi:hypothetical protein
MPLSFEAQGKMHAGTFMVEQSFTRDEIGVSDKHRG